MTETSRAPEHGDLHWRQAAGGLADLLRDRGDLTDPAWHAAVKGTPRHLLVPEVWEQNGSPEWTRVDVTGPDGLALVYSPTTLITKVDAHGRAISSSTKPDLMVRMLETLDVGDNQTVLEIGTGAGYNIALLAHRLGDDNVASVDVDAELVESARARLASFDVFPTLAAVDGERGFPEQAPYDRIIATCSVPAVPWAWAEQVRDGGRVLVSVMPGAQSGNLVLLEKHPDRLEGRFTHRLGQFMAMRHNNSATEHRHAGVEREHAPSRRTTSAPAEPWKTSPVAWLWTTLALPDLTPGYILDDHGAPIASRISAPDSSWVTVPLGGGDRTITEAGPTPIWQAIEDADQFWQIVGQPSWERLGLTVTSERQAIWLDHPDSTYHWAIKETVS